MEFKEKFRFYTDRFEKILSQKLDGLNLSAPEKIILPMRYAVENGGKRIRPVLCYAVAEMLGVSLEDADDIAVSIEMIHSYSLVHDDLPAMDNDDWRRGKPSTHKKFGEAYGILAGDALLNFAFENMLGKENIDNNYINAVRYVAKCAGYSGMIGGQALDIDADNIAKTEENLYRIIENKTAKLIKAPIVAASLIAGGKYKKELEEFGDFLGIMFQITDDIMDVSGSFKETGKTPEKDVKSGKLTAVSVFGLEKAQQLSEFYCENAKRCIKDIPNSEFLSQFADTMFLRKS